MGKSYMFALPDARKINILFCKYYLECTCKLTDPSTP